MADRLGTRHARARAAKEGGACAAASRPAAESPDADNGDPVPTRGEKPPRTSPPERTSDVIAFPAHRMQAVHVLIRKHELAEHWGVSERWIEMRQKNDGLPVQKDAASRFVRYDVAACEAWRQARLVP